VYLAGSTARGGGGSLGSGAVVGQGSAALAPAGSMSLGVTSPVGCPVAVGEGGAGASVPAAVEAAAATTETAGALAELRGAAAAAAGRLDVLEAGIVAGARRSEEVLRAVSSRHRCKQACTELSAKVGVVGETCASQATRLDEAIVQWRLGQERLDARLSSLEEEGRIARAGREEPAQAVGDTEALVLTDRGEPFATSAPSPRSPRELVAAARLDALERRCEEAVQVSAALKDLCLDRCTISGQASVFGWEMEERLRTIAEEVVVVAEKAMGTYVDAARAELTERVDVIAQQCFDAAGGVRALGDALGELRDEVVPGLRQLCEEALHLAAGATAAGVAPGPPSMELSFGCSNTAFANRAGLPQPPPGAARAATATSVAPSPAAGLQAPPASAQPPDGGGGGSGGACARRRPSSAASAGRRFRSPSPGPGLEQYRGPATPRTHEPLPPPSMPAVAPPPAATV